MKAEKNLWYAGAAISAAPGLQGTSRRKIEALRHIQRTAKLHVRFQVCTFSQEWRGPNATASVYPGNGKDVQPLAGSVAQPAGLRSRAKNRGLPVRTIKVALEGRLTQDYSGPPRHWRHSRPAHGILACFNSSLIKRALRGFVEREACGVLSSTGFP